MTEQSNPRTLAGDALTGAMRSVRELTIAATADLAERQWRVPYHVGIQPVAWDLAHIGWFWEFWMLRGPHRMRPDGTWTGEHQAEFFDPDTNYDSARVDHPTRWKMPLYEREELYDRLQTQLVICVERCSDASDAEQLYFARLGLLHECMHHEALLWTRDLLRYPAPDGYAMPTVEEAADVQFDGGEVVLGKTDAAEFAFDNEVPARPMTLQPFSIDAVPVTNRRFLEFVEADGYSRTEYWPGRAGAFLARIGRRHPERWRRTPGGSFEHRWFDSWRPLALDEPVCHVSAYEAEAYCRFAGRRLPTAAEWEAAASRIQWGKMVWEWTSTPFAPYPNFRPGPYSTYSAPWFHKQREMRGGAFATSQLVHDRAYRNFFLPQRTDVFAGFRTAGS